MTLQALVGEWVVKCLGLAALDRKERALRVLEEAAELAQAEYVTYEQALRNINRVYSRPSGNPAQEAGGLGITLFAWAASSGENLMELVQTEYRRISQPEMMEKIRQKQKEKEAAGVGIAPS